MFTNLDTRHCAMFVLYVVNTRVCGRQIAVVSNIKQIFERLEAVYGVSLKSVK